MTKFKIWAIKNEFIALIPLIITAFLMLGSLVYSIPEWSPALLRYFIGCTLILINFLALVTKRYSMVKNIFLIVSLLAAFDLVLFFQSFTTYSYRFRLLFLNIGVTFQREGLIIFLVNLLLNLGFYKEQLSRLVAWVNHKN